MCECSAHSLVIVVQSDGVFGVVGGDRVFGVAGCDRDRLVWRGG